MKWSQINVDPKRLNGLKFRVTQLNQREPPTTVPKLLDHILDRAGIALITDQEFNRKLEVLNK